MAVKNDYNLEKKGLEYRIVDFQDPVSKSLCDCLIGKFKPMQPFLTGSFKPIIWVVRLSKIDLKKGK